jgi:hypothetical protein
MQKTHIVHLESHGPYKIHIMYTLSAMAHANTHNIHLESYGRYKIHINVHLACHGPYKIHIMYTLAHYVYFVSAMTLKVYIMCILYGSWHSRCTLCVFVWAMILKGYIMGILYGPWHSRCTLCVSHGPYKIHIMYTLRVMTHTKYTYCTPLESWPIQIHIMYTLSALYGS